VSVHGKHETGSTFSNDLATIPGFQIENLTCAIICAASTTFFGLNVAGIHEKNWFA
jgi:hypothetical protein